MDDFMIELHRGFYAETLGYQARKERCSQEFGERVQQVESSRFLVNRVHFKRLATAFAGLAFFGVLFVGWVSVKYQEELSVWNQRIARVNLKQVSFAKDIEISLNKVFSQARNYFSTDLSRDRGKVSSQVGREIQLVSDRISSLEFLFQGTSAIPQLNSFQLVFEDWKLQTLESFDDVEKGQMDLALSQWTEASESLSVDLLRRASELSALADDYARREQLHLESVKAAYSQLLWTAWSLLFILVVASVWMLANFIGAVEEFMMWFRRISWDLLANSEKLKRVLAPSDKELVPVQSAIEKDVSEIRSVFKKLTEAFSGNINGERFASMNDDSAVNILNFEEGHQQMKALLESRENLQPTEAEQKALLKVVGE